MRRQINNPTIIWRDRFVVIQGEVTDGEPKGSIAVVYSHIATAAALSDRVMAMAEVSMGESTLVLHFAGRYPKLLDGQADYMVGTGEQQRANFADMRSFVKQLLERMEKPLP